MKIGDRVYVAVIGNDCAPCQVIDMNGPYVTVAGAEEQRRSTIEGRKPVGVSFLRELVREKKTVKNN